MNKARAAAERENSHLPWASADILYHRAEVAAGYLKLKHIHKRRELDAINLAIFSRGVKNLNLSRSDLKKTNCPLDARVH